MCDRFGLRTLVTAIVAAMTLFAAETQAKDAPAVDLKNVRILVCAQYWDLLHIPAVERLKAAGAEVRRQGRLCTLTWDEVKQYHLIIACAHSPKSDAAGATATDALRRFVDAGGGLLFFRHSYHSKKGDVYLKPFGASVPWELVQDPSNTYRCPIGFRLTYAYTDRLLKGHPVTEGVPGIWYSAGKRFQFHTSPLKVSDQWKVLATAMPEARSLWVSGGLHEEHLTKPGQFATAPPIIATRQWGKGAIVLVGISPMEVFLGQGLPAYLDIAMEKGDGVRPSGMKRLYENAIRWLAKHARAAEAIGQGELKPLEKTWEKPRLFDWTGDVFGGEQCTSPARGVIGAHSMLSDGKATPQAMIAKAKALGLGWLAFTERLEQFSPSKWAELRRICKQASTPDFAALPGLDYQDKAGARYVVFGDFDWPPEKVFSADKKRIVQPQWWFNIKTPPNGPYDAGHSPLRPWDFSMYNFWPVRTTVAGKQVDESLSAYRYLHGIHDDPFPMAVEMLYDERELAAAATRMCNFITKDRPGDLAAFYRGLTYYGSHRGFVSDGPIVTDWRAVNATRNSGAKWWHAGTERYQVRLTARSAANITDIRIYDGSYLLRRLKPNQKQVVVTLDLPHDQQRQLTADITDAEGKRAVTGGLSIYDRLNWRFMCADRGNTICDAIQVDARGAYLTGPTAPYQRKMTVFGLCAGYGERHFRMLPPACDGGMRPIGLHVMPRIRCKGYVYQPDGTTLESKMEVPVASRDGILQDNTVVGYFPGKTDAWNPKTAPKDIKGVRVRFRNLDIVKRAGDPGVLLVEGTLRFERAMKLESLNLFDIFHASQPGEGDHYAIVTPETTVSGMTAGERFEARGRAVPGSYVCVFPSLWGSSGIVALDEGYRFSVYAKAPGVGVHAALTDMPRQMKAGQELHYRYVLMHGRLDERPNTADWERFVKTMGFRGKPAYTVTDVRLGKVRGTKFLLELEPSDGGFVGTVSRADLPIRLPVRVAGMNPNWTFAWFDLDRKQWFPSALDPLIRQGFFTLNTRVGKHRFFAGHPVTADDPDVRITILSDGSSWIDATLNNVDDRAKKIRVRLHPALGKSHPKDLDLAPGDLKTVRFPMRVHGS